MYSFDMPVEIQLLKGDLCGSGSSRIFDSGIANCLSALVAIEFIRCRVTFWCCDEDSWSFVS